MSNSASVSSSPNSIASSSAYISGDNSEISQKKTMSSTGWSKFSGFATDAIHVGQEPEQWAHHEIVPPICLSTTFWQPAPAEPKSFDYSRAGNATRHCLELCLASLEAAKYCKTFASGLAAISAITSKLNAGDRIVSTSDMYGGTVRFFDRILPKLGIHCINADLTPDNVGDYLKPETKMLWIESPSNPLLHISDIAGICSKAKERSPEVLIVVDNTFMSPYFQRPLVLGADMAVHSVTKYINGHSDVVMGCVCTNRKDLYDHLEFQQLAVGAVPSPFDCYMVNRGVKTLHVRMKAHEENGLEIARYLESHPMVEKVLFPGLPSHPQHEIHKRQTTGSSGMVSFYIRGGQDEAVVFLKSLKLFALAESLGGYESLAEHPGLMTHASVSKGTREKIGISDNLIRLSVGIEDVEDLKLDLENAFRASQNQTTREATETS